MAAIHNIVNTVLNILMPVWCLGCGKKGEQLCRPCLNGLFEMHEWCMACKEFTLEGLCKKCKKGVALDRVFWVSSYGNPLTRNIVGHFKYRGGEKLAPLLANIMARTAKGALDQNAHILSIPLHKRKERERGFNQAELLAEELRKKLALPVIQKGILVRMRNNLPQAKTKSREERKENIKGAFAVTDNSSVAGKNILLVDDVATTGATLFEAASVLKEAGVGKISAIVFAHG